MGVVYTDPAALLSEVGTPIITVGDVVTYHLMEASTRPDLALVDRRTERTPVEDGVTEAIHGFDREVTVPNPPATLTAELLEAIKTGIDRAPTESTLVVVDGEEDLGTLPAVLAAPTSASIVYGQPGAGMVHVPVDREATERARALLVRMSGDHGRVWTALGIDGATHSGEFDG